MAESPNQRELPPDGIDLDLGEFDLSSVEELEGTVLGQILNELYPEEMADGSLGQIFSSHSRHSRFSSFSAHSQHSQFGSFSSFSSFDSFSSFSSFDSFSSFSSFSSHSSWAGRV
jgi:hypothetical protein